MPSLEAVVVEVPPQLERLGPAEVWGEMALAIPPAFQPMLADLAAGAPVGKTGKLTEAGFNVDLRRRDQGLVQGLDVVVWSGVAYAHLVSEGHEEIPRGPAVKGRKLSRSRRAELRANLKARRSAGSVGRVAGNPWVEAAVAAHREEIVASIERQLARAFGQ